MHTHDIENEYGELEDQVTLCSDACHRDWCWRTGNIYQGRNGPHENEHTTYCENCGVVIGGFDAECEHMHPTVVNLIGVPEDEYCEHGNLVRAEVGA